MSARPPASEPSEPWPLLPVPPAHSCPPSQGPSPGGPGAPLTSHSHRLLQFLGCGWGNSYLLKCSLTRFGLDYPQGSFSKDFGLQVLFKTGANVTGG